MRKKTNSTHTLSTKDKCYFTMHIFLIAKGSCIAYWLKYILNNFLHQRIYLNTNEFTSNMSNSQVVQWVKNLPAMQEMQETRVQSLGQEDPLEKEMEIHSSILAWRIPWTEEPGMPWSTGS